jgi:hypothetical protein
MKRTLLLLLCLSAVSSALHAQVVDANVCDILAAPQTFDGKTVRIKGTVVADFEQFAIVDSTCKQSIKAIWLDYPEGTKAKAGPVAFVHLQLAANSPGQAVDAKRAEVVLEKNQDFKQFDTFLSTPAKTSGMCLGCGRYTVKATLTGRLDGVAMPIIDSDDKGKITALQGFGNLNRYSARLVLQSVSEVVPQEVDYSKSAAATKGDSVPGSSGDPVAAAHAAAKLFGAGNAAGDMLEKAVAVFGKPGETNGVTINFGTPNEVLKGEDPKGAGDSPDGLLYNCTFDMTRLKASALSRAIAHVGSHIADYRGGDTHEPVYNLEFKAWQTTVVLAIATGQKTLTLPGGHVIWNAAWPPADRDKMVSDGIRDSLSD